MKKRKTARGKRRWIGKRKREETEMGRRSCSGTSWNLISGV